MLSAVYSSETWRVRAFLNKAAATWLRVVEAEQIKAREHVGPAQGHQAMGVLGG